MTILDPRTADKVAKLCGLFSSDHDGERAAAAAKVDQIIRACGLTWHQVIATDHRLGGDKELIDFALAGTAVLTDWECEFLHSIRSWSKPLTEKQSRILKAIVAKVLAEKETA